MWKIIAERTAKPATTAKRYELASYLTLKEVSHAFNVCLPELIRELDAKNPNADVDRFHVERDGAVVAIDQLAIDAAAKAALTITLLGRDAAADAKEREWWIATEVMPSVIEKLEAGGVDMEEIPRILADYAKWMADNIELWIDVAAPRKQ